jgi:hypothetical protein
MHILEHACTGCGDCVPNCYRAAISPAGEGKFAIDPAKCDQCAKLHEPFCARACRFSAVEGAFLKAGIMSRDHDPRPRIRVTNLQYFVGAMFFDGVDYYRERSGMPLIHATHAKAYVNPDLQIVIARGLDDFCWGCARKKDGPHLDGNVASDLVTEALTDLKPNQAVRYWDALRLCYEKLPPSIFREKTNIEEQYIKIYEAALGRLGPKAAKG